MIGRVSGRLGWGSRRVLMVVVTALAMLGATVTGAWAAGPTAYVINAHGGTFSPIDAATNTGQQTLNDPTLVGDWDFYSGSTADTTGNWSSFDLYGDATVSSSGLQVDGPETAMTLRRAGGTRPAIRGLGSTQRRWSLVSHHRLRASSRSAPG